MAKGEAQVLKIARRRVKSYQKESELMGRHREALECLDCEEFLQLGIEAYQWLIRADQSIRRAVCLGRCEWSDESQEAIEFLFTQWAGPCEFARNWINVQVGRGFDVTNKDQFLECCEQVEAIVESFGDAELPKAMADLQDEALAEYRNGETAEFV